MTSARVATKIAIKLAISLLVGGVCLWLAARQVDAAELLSALSGFSLLYLFPLVGISLLIQVFRAWRWRIELSPLEDLPFSLTWQVVAVAYMMINVLPFRLGEPVRPLLMSWKSSIAVPAIVGNWVFEKMMDTAAMVLFIHIALVANDLPHWAHKASAGSLVAFCTLLFIVVGFWLGGERFFNATIGRLLPAGAQLWCLHVLSSARDGLQILPNKRLVGVVFLVTLGL